MSLIKFETTQVETAGMECPDRKWAIYCPKLHAWVRKFGSKNLVLTKHYDTVPIDKNSRRNTEAQISRLLQNNADRWRNMISNNNYILENQ